MADAKFTPLQRAARELIRREMHQYDALSRQSRLRYERAVAQTNEPLYDAPTRSCAHGVLLHEPCAKCERNEQDCKVYETAMLCRIRELLKQLS